MRNEGMSAPFTSRGSPFHPDTTTLYNGNKYLGLFLNQNSVFDTAKPIYKVSLPSQSISVGGTNHALYFLNWTKTGATLKDSTKDTTAVVFTSSNATLTANVKGSLLSNNASTFSNNSQRKFVRTPANGWLHQVYEDSGHVWYEVSKDSGTTWTLQSPVSGGGSPGHLDVGGGKCPSIDYSHTSWDSTSVVIVFEQPSGSYYTIMQMVYTFNSGGQWILQYVNPIAYIPQAGTDTYSAVNANPSIVWGADGSGLLTWERKNSNSSYPPKIYYLLGQIDGINGGNTNWGFQPSIYPDTITGTTSNSTNATSSYSAPDGAFYTAWEQDVNSTSSSIKWSSVPSNGTRLYQTPTTLSTSAFSKNYKPSLIVQPNDHVQCSWIGDVDGTGQWMNVNALERDIDYTTIQKVGAGVQSVSINTDNASNYYVGYSQNMVS